MLNPNELRIESWPEPATNGMVFGMPRGIRATHLPTGLVETCNSERSQHANRDKALAALEVSLIRVEWRLA